MNKLWDRLATLAVFILIVLLGNLLGDQSTLRDCASKGHAYMLGGGNIECTVIKESK
jgi:hypothetical protein